MSEVGRQLVDNEQAQGRVLEDAGRAWGDLLTALSFGTAAGLADIDTAKGRAALERLSAAKEKMKVLRKRAEELGMAAVKQGPNA